MELFKTIFTYLIESFKHFFISDYGESLLYLFLIGAVVLILFKVFKHG